MQKKKKKGKLNKQDNFEVTTYNLSPAGPLNTWCTTWNSHPLWQTVVC